MSDAKAAALGLSRPHKCPVCNGVGNVHAGFYTNGVASSMNPVECRACQGKGVIWS